jgi:hypothetical protein
VCACVAILFFCQSVACEPKPTVNKRGLFFVAFSHTKKRRCLFSVGLGEVAEGWQKNKIAEWRTLAPTPLPLCLPKHKMNSKNN